MPDSNQHSRAIEDVLALAREAHIGSLASRPAQDTIAAAYIDLVEQLRAAEDGKHHALVAHGVEKQAKHNVEAELRGLKEQYESLSENNRHTHANLDFCIEQRTRLEEQLETLQREADEVVRWFNGKRWEGHDFDRSSFGGHDYTANERAIGYGTYRDPRFLPALLERASNPASGQER